jgi:hypothetical protein
VTIVTADGGERWVAQTRKETIAQAVLDEVQRLLEGAGEDPDGARAGTRSTARV